MKLNLLYFGIFTDVFLLLVHSYSVGKSENYLDPVVFQNPADSFYVNTLCHWMANHITSEGITADLESIKKRYRWCNNYQYGVIGEQ